MGRESLAFFASTSVRIGFRPSRVGCVVPPNDVESLVSAARRATALWGGISSVVLPVTEEELQDLDARLDVLNVDELEVFGYDEWLRGLPNRKRRLCSPRLGAGAMQDVGGSDLGGVDVRLAVSHYYESFVRLGQGQTRAVLPIWNRTKEFRVS